MKMSVWKKGFILFMSFMVFLLAGCGSTGNKSADSKKPDVYEIGLIMPQTGDSASFGNDQVKAAQWAVDDINAKGGINGIKLKLNIEDSQADPKRAITGYQKVVTFNKAPIIITAWSSVINALAPMAEQDKVLMFSDGANDPKIKTLGKYTRTAYPLADIDITALAKYTYEKLGKKKAAIIYINNDTGKYAAEVYKKTFEAAGGKIVAMESHEPGKLDFSAQLSKIKQANPDVLHIQSLVQETPQIVIKTREMGINALLTSYAAAENQQLLKQAGDTANGLIYTSLAPDASVPEVKNYFERWQKQEGRMPNGAPYTEYLYDAPYIVKAVIEQMEKTGQAYTGENALKALTDLKEITTPITGKIVFNVDGSVSKPVFIKKIDNGQFVTVDRIDPK